jgi:uncharacterized protein YbcI
LYEDNVLKEVEKARRLDYQRTIVNYITAFFKKATGKGPQNIKVRILEDIIEILMEGYLTDMEKYLLVCSTNKKIVIDIRSILEKQLIESFVKEPNYVMGKSIEILYVDNDFDEDKCKLILIMR